MKNENIYTKSIVTIEELRGLERKVSKVHFDFDNNKIIPHETILYKKCQNVWEIYRCDRNEEPRLTFRQPNLDGPSLGLLLSKYNCDGDIDSLLGSKGFIRVYMPDYYDDPDNNLIIRDTPYVNDYKNEMMIPQKNKEEIRRFRMGDIKKKKPEDLGLKKEELEILQIILSTIEDEGKKIETEKPWEY